MINELSEVTKVTGKHGLLTEKSLDVSDFGQSEMPYGSTNKKDFTQTQRSFGGYYCGDKLPLSKLISIVSEGKKRGLH